MYMYTDTDTDTPRLTVHPLLAGWSSITASRMRLIRLLRGALAGWPFCLPPGQGYGKHLLSLPHISKEGHHSPGY